MKKTLAALLLAASVALVTGSVLAADDTTNGTGQKDLYFDLIVPKILEVTWTHADNHILFDFSQTGAGATDAYGLNRAGDTTYRAFLSNNMAGQWFAPTTTDVPHLMILSNVAKWSVKVWQVDDGQWQSGFLAGPASNKDLARLQTYINKTGGNVGTLGAWQQIVKAPSTLFSSDTLQNGAGQNDYDFYFALHALLNDQFVFGTNGKVQGTIEADVSIFQP